MAKFVDVMVEEHLVKTIRIEVPNELTDVIDREIYAMDKVKEMYKNQEIILTADDFNGTTLIQTHDFESDIDSEWINLDHI